MDGQLNIFDFLNSVKSEDDTQKVTIEGVINPKISLKPIEGIRLSCGDLKLITNMLHDYINKCDCLRKDDVQYKYYYRDKFEQITKKIEQAINYNYEEALKRCRKAQTKKDDDIGEDGLTLVVTRGMKKGSENNVQDGHPKQKEQYE